LRYSTHHVVWAAHAAYVLGAAERALEIFRDTIAPKRKRPWGVGALIESPVVQKNFGEAAHLVYTSQVLFEKQVETVVEAYERGSEPDWDDRAHLNTAAVGI